MATKRGWAIGLFLALFLAGWMGSQGRCSANTRIDRLLPPAVGQGVSGFVHDPSEEPRIGFLSLWFGAAAGVGLLFVLFVVVCDHRREFVLDPVAKDMGSLSPGDNQALLTADK